MKYLWTPWRMKFIMNAKKQQGCIFCTLLEQKDGPENLILHRTKDCFVIINMYPYNTAHLMVIPIVHGANLAELDPNVMNSLGALLQKTISIVQKVYQPTGFNVGMNLGEAAGAGVPDHLHYHIVPRWVGDTNFMPVVGQTKVIPETPEQTFHKLKDHFHTIS